MNDGVILFECSDKAKGRNQPTVRAEIKRYEDKLDLLSVYCDNKEVCMYVANNFSEDTHRRIANITVQKASDIFQKTNKDITFSMINVLFNVIESYNMVA